MHAGAHKGKRKHQLCFSRILNITGLLRTGQGDNDMQWEGGVGDAKGLVEDWGKNGKRRGWCPEDRTWACTELWRKDDNWVMMRQGMTCFRKEQHRFEVPEVWQASLCSGHKSYDITAYPQPPFCCGLKIHRKKKGHTYVDYLADWLVLSNFG